MLTISNLNNALESLGFLQHKQTLSKYFPQHECYLKVDFVNKLIIYPEDKGFLVRERQTCNFSSDENFVVLECVNRLLEKGYKPEHIELEPKWKLGHGASGGRADILIKDNHQIPLLIIECKTYGREFEKAWKDTEQDGGQLFSYAQQISEAQYLCLYASDYGDGKINYLSHVIAHKDNQEYLLNNPKLASFANNAGDVRKRFAVWRDTYQLEFTTKGIFEHNIQAYQIGKDKYTLDDLSEISEEVQQKQYNIFATILRQYNVSGRENAFDKLVNLLLCKIVDESKNAANLNFYWKGTAYDSYFDLQDRLQHLYQLGMREFLGEEVTYIHNSDIDQAFRFFKRDPNATKEAIKGYFRQLKFFTNSDFAFIDVHNERLFFENSKILLELVQMWQDLRLKSDHQNQFLGDMFEGFLDAGVKQSEGQFFTPMPICRFMLQSLPLENLIRDSANIPLCIDYACGAGHFLTELANQIKPFVSKYQKGDPHDYYRALHGIEKEYRLSKVAKVSAFMYGQDEIKIVYADGLAKNEQISEGNYSLLIANPPYSVKGFLATLEQEEREKYQLNSTVSNIDTSNSIETFFLERAQQLLTSRGIAAIIVPSSVLSNGDATYTKTRELILQAFDIIAIAELGSGTFGKTGTNTVTLFLRKKAINPAPADHYLQRVQDWFNFAAIATEDESELEYQDIHLAQCYCAHIGINWLDYQTLLTGQPNSNLLAHEMFIDYHKMFDNLTEVNSLRKTKIFRSLTHSEQEQELMKRFIRYIRAIEQDKLYYFVLAQDQVNQVLIVKSPSDTKEQKQFLGYEWSSAKGNEGIKLVKDQMSKHLTPMYDETDRYNPNKINTLIQANFNAERIVIPEELQAYVSLTPLANMLDFGRVEFNKQMALVAKKELVVSSKYPLIKLGDITTIESGGTPSSTNQDYWDGDINWVTLVDTKQKYLTETKRKISYLGLKNSSAKMLPINAILFSSRATIGEICIAKINTATNQGYKNFICDESKVHYEYLYYILVKLVPVIDNMASGMTYKEISKTELANFKIPLPPLEIQQQIVTECQAIDQAVILSEQSITALNAKITNLINNLYRQGYHQCKLSHDGLSIINPSKSEIKNVAHDLFVSFVEMASVSNAGYILNKEDRLLGTLRKGSYTYFAENDILIAKITPCMENGKCAIALRLTNKIGMGSSEFHVIRCDNNRILTKFVFVILNREEVRKQAEQNMTGSSGHRRVPATFYSNYELPVPPLEIQQQLITEIEILEAEIIQQQAIIDAAPARKQAILATFLE